MRYSCPCQIDECVLCEAKLFFGLSSAQVCEIRGMLTKQGYRTHEVLFREGDPCNHLFVLRTGQVKLTTSLADGREQILGVRVAGQLLGFETLDDNVYPYTATTLTPVDTCKITHQDMLRVMEQNSIVSLRVIRRLNEELEQAQGLIRDLGLKTAHERVASFIMSLIPNYDTPTDQLLLVMSRQEIAELLGMTVETVSRVITEFKNQGVIEAPRGEIRILDHAQLEKLASATVHARVSG